MNSTTTCTQVATSTEECVTIGDGYFIDIGSTLMIGGLLSVIIAYWLVGLIRRKYN